MYLAHFKLKERPFTLTPDLTFFMKSPTHQEALNVLMVALRSGEGFIKITGEVGTGKTMLCRKLLATLDGKACTAYIPNPLQSPHQLYCAIAGEIGVQSPSQESINAVLEQIHKALFHYARKGRRVVLCIDEAQDMPEATLEAVRLLSNLETEKRKLLQIIFFGQPELNQRLQQTRLRQLQQRICFSYHLKPLNASAVKTYIDFRLQRAGWQSNALISPSAVRLIARSSRGIPRLVNVICHKAMMASFGQGQQKVTRRHVRAAIQDTESVAPCHWWWPRRSVSGINRMSAVCHLPLIGRFGGNR